MSKPKNLIITSERELRSITNVLQDKPRTFTVDYESLETIKALFDPTNKGYIVAFDAETGERV